MKFFFISILLLIITQSKGQSFPEAGSVFVNSVYQMGNDFPQDSIFPITAFRIDKIEKNTLLVKYNMGSEKFLDVDFLFLDSCQCYLSNKQVVFSPNGKLRDYIFLKIISDTNVFLYLQSDNSKTYSFNRTYIDKVNLKTHRDVYYAEQGFYIYKKDKKKSNK